eukprot:7026113-Prymnesium_polylepis.2
MWVRKRSRANVRHRCKLEWSDWLTLVHVKSPGFSEAALPGSRPRLSALASRTWSSPRWPGLLQFRVFDHART